MHYFLFSNNQLTLAFKALFTAFCKVSIGLAVLGACTFAPPDKNHLNLYKYLKFYNKCILVYLTKNVFFC